MGIARKRFGGKGAVAIATFGRWTLFEFPDKASNGWRNFKLDSAGIPKGEKLRAYWFGWNGRRMSVCGTRDAGQGGYSGRLLRERPELHADVLDFLLSESSRAA